MTTPATAHDHGQTCACMATHSPAPLELNRHHILPLYAGGTDELGNIAWLCPTTHVNVHELLRLFERHEQTLTWRQVLDLYEQTVNRYAYQLAAEGFRRMQEMR